MSSHTAIRALMPRRGQPLDHVRLACLVAELALPRLLTCLFFTLDVDEIATALSDQTDYKPRWLIDPGTGEIASRTSGIDPIDLDESDLLPIEPHPIARLVNGHG